MSELENLLEENIQRLKNGSNPAELFMEKNELQLVQNLLNLPKKTAPLPVLRRKYILHEAKRPIWSAVFSLPRFITAGSLLVIMLVGLTGAAAYNSVPGQPLFSVKRAGEEIVLAFTTNPVKRANLEVALAQKRLSEAENAIQSGNTDPTLELAALNALSQQTQAALDQVKTITSNNAIASADHPIVNSVENLSQKQQALLNQVKTQNNQPSGAVQLTLDSQAKVTELKNLVFAATADQTLTNLSATSSTSSEATITPAANSSTTPGTDKKKDTSTSTPATSRKSADATQDNQNTAVPANPNQASAGFILEDPTPQFNNQ